MTLIRWIVDNIGGGVPIRYRSPTLVKIVLSLNLSVRHAKQSTIALLGGSSTIRAILGCGVPVRSCSILQLRAIWDYPNLFRVQALLRCASRTFLFPISTPHQQNQSPTEGRGGRSHRLSERGGEATGGQKRRASAKSLRGLPDHGPNARRDSLRLPSERTAQDEKHAVMIQRNVRGSGRRKKFLTLQSAREDLECHLQALASAIANALAQQQQQQRQQQGGGREGKLKNASMAAVQLLETSREDGIAKPPFELLQAMYRGLDDVNGALVLLSQAEEEEEDGGNAGSPCTASMVESCGAAEKALDAVREAVGADITAFRERATPPGPSAAGSSPAVQRHHQSSPAGSGRAAVVAMSSSRGGLLVPPDGPPAARRDPVAGNPSGGDNEAEGDWPRHPQPVPLRTLDVQGIATLLRVHGLEEHVPGFVAQEVDGVMLSDPNLCEADFVELGIAGGNGEGTRSSRARMVSFFRRCQEDGVVLPTAGGSSSLRPSELGGAEPGSHAGGSALGDQRQARPSTGNGPVESTEESSWRRGSVLVDRENQRVLAQITVDPSEAGGAAAVGGAGDGRRMSVTLIQGVVVTADGREAGLVDNAEELSGIGAEDGAAAAAAMEQGGAVAAASGGGSPPVTSRGRRASLGLPRVTLCKEPGRAGEGGSLETAAQDLPIPPGVAVTTADTTVNVFQ